MCLTPSPAQDNSAATARAEEEQRTARINAGKAKIDEAFSVFTPDYFNKFQNDYLGNYNPQVDEKYGYAQRDLRYNTARAGIQDSSGGLDAFSKLARGYDDQRRAVASNALEATNNVRTQVEQNKSDLYNQNQSAADPSLAAISAAGRAGSLSTPPSFSPIGDVFAGLTGAGTAYLQGRNQGLPAGYAGMFTPGGSLANGGGSGRVVT